MYHMMNGFVWAFQNSELQIWRLNLSSFHTEKHIKCNRETCLLTMKYDFVVKRQPVIHSGIILQVLCSCCQHNKLEERRKNKDGSTSMLVASNLERNSRKTVFLSEVS
jgi:hypothetical protein